MIFEDSIFVNFVFTNTEGIGEITNNDTKASKVGVWHDWRKTNWLKIGRDKNDLKG